MIDNVYNSAVEKVRGYLNSVFGDAFEYRSCAVALPLYLRRFSPLVARVGEIEILFAFVDEDVNSAEEYTRIADALTNQIGIRQVVFVFSAITTLKRNQLMQAWVAFVVPGKQFFLPPLMQISERLSKPGKKREKISPSAQAILIRQLTCGDINGCSAEEVARQMDLSKVAVHAAFDELAGFDLAKQVDHWPQRIKFESSGRDLWIKALPMMRSPVKQVLYNAMPGFDHWVKAGDSAMARLTNLAPDVLPVYACKNGAQKSLNQFVRAENRYEARSILQVWWYNPIAWGRDDVVDPLSLYLSLRESRDPRVQGELEALIRGMKW